MALRDNLIKTLTPLLQEGETVEHVFMGKTKLTTNMFGLIGLLLSKNEIRVVGVTNRRILVANTGKYAVKNVKNVVAELPRQTRIGEPSGLWWKCTSLGEPFYIHKRFHKDVQAADAAE